MGLHKITSGWLLAGFTALAGLSVSAQPAGTPPPPAAQSANARNPMKIYLGYIRSSDAQTDAVMQKGLENLSEALRQRTGIEPEGVVGLDIERDDLSSFRFIYSQVGENAPTLSEKAQKKVQTYLDHGGLFVFDIRNLSEPVGSLKSLYHMLGDVALQVPAALDKDHVLHETFYRLARLRGTFDYDTIKVEKSRVTKEGNISGVIIGENNWAGAWAGTTLPPGSKEREMALRTGINYVVYAYTGNYKQDQKQIMSNPDKLDNK